ncbi:MAG: hypothetical protein JSU68_03150 [Phycisphaerales bacterium]|nr:MAG: hypothetical protein JSU68_03150 [Phycisphaerales bacterium]
MKACSASLMSLLFVVPTVWAQEQQDQSQRRRNREATWEYEVVHLKNLDIQEAADLISDLNPQIRVKANENIGALVIRGDRASIDQIVLLLEDMEKMVPVEPIERVELIRVKNRSLNELIAQLVQSVDECQFAGDAATGQLIVRGSDHAIELVHRLLGELDRPHRALQLTFDFLRVGYEPASDKAAWERVPDRLASVQQALLRSGAAEVVYLGGTVVQSAEGFRFGSMGEQTTQGPMFKYEIEGRLEFIEGDDVVRLKVEAEAYRGLRREESNRPRWENRFAVESTLNARIGEAVVLATAPAAEDTQSGALVLVVTPQWPQQPSPRN